MEQLPATAGRTSVPDWLDAGWARALLGGREPDAAYERFVAQGLGEGAPWKDLKGQIWLGGAAFLKRMERLAQVKPAANVPREQRQPSRPSAAAITAQVLSTYGIKDEKTLRTHAHQEAFQVWAYLLRRAANLRLTATAECCNVSPSRISKIQRDVEVEERSAQSKRLIDRYNVKN